MSKLQCLRAYISETIGLNKKRLKNLLNNFLRSFQIRKDPTSDIGTLNAEKMAELYLILCSIYGSKSKAQ
jgi:hypothetical protein